MEPADNESKVILVAEDDPSLAHFLRRHLEIEGYRPVMVETGHDALRLATSAHPALIVLDVGLPDMNGLAVCRQIKSDERTATIPILFLTGRDDITDRVAGLDAGAQDYLVKPFALPEFQARLRAILRGRDEVDESNQLGPNHDEVLTILNHEFRAPLTVISMASQILAENQSLSDERREQLIQSIRGSAGTLTQIVDDLLYLTNPSRRLRSSNIRAVTQTVVEAERPRVHEYDLHLVARMPAQLPPIMLDEAQYRRSLLHLIDNAIKFTPRGGVITVTLAVAHHGHLVTEQGGEHDAANAPPVGLLPPGNQEPWLIVAVRDTGIGIAPEHHRRVFEPFYQVDSSTTRAAAGLGLGLAVVAAFVRAHHGHLAVRSGNGLGTAVHLALPLHPENVAAASDHGTEGPESA